MQKVLVTGGHGFIASHVIEELKSRGIKVVTNVRSNRYELEPSYKTILEDVEIYEVDVKDARTMQKLVEQVDGVIHLAAMLGTKHVKNAKRFYLNNLFPSIDLFESCVEYDTPITYIGVGNYFEHNNYSNSKTAAERELLKYSKFFGLKGAIVRALNAVGERQKYLNTGKIAPTFILNALFNKDLPVYGGKENCSNMDLVYAGDVAKILVEALVGLDKGSVATGTIFEAGTGYAPSVYEIAELIIKKTNSSSKILEIPMRDGETPKSTVIANNPYPLEYKTLDELLDKTIEYYKAEVDNGNIQNI